MFDLEMTMKGLFITFESPDPLSGVSKKIQAQCEGFRRNGVGMDLFCIKQINGKWFSTINGIPFHSFGKWTLMKSIRYRLFYSYLFNLINERQYNFVYIRYNMIATPIMVRFLKNIRKIGVRILLEIPTFPYDDEFKKHSLINRLLLYRVEKKSRMDFHLYIDRIVTVQKYDIIYNIPTIRISNGVDIAKLPLRNPKSHQGYNMICVASLTYWHGYDRLIQGIGNYYQNGGKEDVNFYVIGDYSNILDDFVKLSRKYKIENRIHIEGFKTGAELDKYFDIADLAIGSLGGHRKGIVESKPLKCVEYAARGIPFIYSEKNTDFENCEFVFKVPEDDSPIDVAQIIHFVSQVKITPADIRLFVNRSLTWDEQMKKVIDEIS